MALNRVSVVPAGVLRVISDGFLTPTRAFSKGAPTIFRKHMPSGIGTESSGMIGCIFVVNGPLEGGIESSFSGTGWGAKGDFIRYSYLYPYISNQEPIHFSKAHSLRYTYSKVGNDQMHIRGEMISEKWTLSGFVRSRPESLWWFEVDFWPNGLGEIPYRPRPIPSGWLTTQVSGDRA